MKLTSIIALLLAALLCFAGCNATEADVENEDEVAEETDGEKNEDKDSENEKDSDDGETASISCEVNAYNSDFKGDGMLTVNSDGTFAVNGSYQNIITSEEFDYASIESEDVAFDVTFEYRGTWTEKDGKIVCRGSNRVMGYEVEDKYKDVLKNYVSYGTDEEDELVKQYIEMLETGKMFPADDEYSYVYELEVEETEDGYRMVAGRDYEYEDPTNLWASYEYENGELVTATHYYAFGGVYYVHYFENEKIDHTDYYDPDGNYTSTSYPDENGEY